ncbi:MAG: hypothetical protein ACXU8S_00740 [Phenylobacterium sp.]
MSHAKIDTVTTAAAEPVDPAIDPRVASLMTEADEARTMFELGWGNAISQAVQFQADWARDMADAWTALQGCKTPAEAMAATQAWANARGQAYADAALRLACSAIPPAEAAAFGGAFRLPE